MSLTDRVISLASEIPPAVEVPLTGLVIWFNLADDASDVLTDPAVSDRFAWSLTQALQNSIDLETTSVVAVWPRKGLSPSANDYATLVREIAIGIVQSAQLDVGVRGIRVNLIFGHDDQIHDINRTLKYFHGPDGGFVAGCTYDLRDGAIEVPA